MIKCTTSFRGCPDGQAYPRQIQVGEELAGDLAIVALEEGWAEDTSRKALGAAPENKARPGPGKKKAARSASSPAARASRSKTSTTS